jgi:type IV fimbrial biogenesis protein FimT
MSSIGAGRMPVAIAVAPRQRGVTLIEMMFVIVVLAILATITAPSFRDASLGPRLTAIANSLHGSIQIARSEAIKANALVTMCASADEESCAETDDWHKGWIVFIARPGEDEDEEDEVIILHRESALPAGYLISEATGVHTLQFGPIGIGNTAAVFKVCRKEPLGRQERVVSMTATGIARVTSTETGSCS